MIILPDRNIPRARLLMPMHAALWRTPSQAQPKDQFGNENVTRFCVRARLNDGHVVWTGWFDDRDDFDVFLYAIASGNLRNDPYVQRLPTPWWPDFDIPLSYEFLTTTFLTTTASSPYTSAPDWNNADNGVECIGGGANSAFAANGGQVHSTGGGAGSYSAIVNFSFATPGTTQATYSIGAQPAAQSGTSTTANGNNGNPTWFNNATDPGAGADNSKCSAKGGIGGVQGAASQNGGAGGDTANSWGTTKNAGGRGGNMTGATGSGASGGGGAAGPAGAGGNGVDTTSTSTLIETNGGTANNGTTAGGVTVGGNGVSGTEFDGSHGCGSGGAGAGNAGTPTTGGSGADYGGAGGGAYNSAGNLGTSGRGAQGLVVLTYTPILLMGSTRIFMM